MKRDPHAGFESLARHDQEEYRRYFDVEGDRAKEKKVALVDYVQYPQYSYQPWTTTTTNVNTTWAVNPGYYAPIGSPPAQPAKIKDEGHEEFAWLDGRIKEICDLAFV